MYLKEKNYSRMCIYKKNLSNSFYFFPLKHFKGKPILELYSILGRKDSL